MIYRISELTKTYGDRTVLDISSMELERGKIYSLLGANGAGKTTLLNILAFLEPPTSGHMIYDSRRVQYSASSLHELRQHVVLVDQHPILFTTTVYKNLEFGLKIRRISGHDREFLINEALELVGMRDFVQAQGTRLSGGETQRVSLARALVLSPQVLLCDEPTSSVDVENQMAIVRILKLVNEQKKSTIVFTTHNRFQFGSLAHDSLYLDHGRLAATVHDNLFSAVITRSENHLTRCAIEDILTIPLPSDKTGRVRIRINPERMEIVRSTSPGDADDLVRGRIRQVSEQDGKIRLLVDAGISLTLLMSADRYHRIQPLAGEQVGIRIAADAVKIE
ncbi:MAG: ATP-binding cassette domain-containing protein [Desulfobacterales bacterium]|nr:ATP-binding cassette domain-containing protein [Desulfobacterales bacterium]MDD4392117.1 ATP-binding cassette domain-containing protein [Desulfobacterales bacterium]